MSGAFITRRNTFSSIPTPTTTIPPSQQRVSSFPTTARDGASAAPCFDFNFSSLKPLDYTSLKDILPPSSLDQGAPSPTAAGRTVFGEGETVSMMRNGLVKQAAWAYLHRPTKAEEAAPPSGGYSLRRLWVRLLVDPVRACVGFFNRMVLPTIRRFSVRLFGVIWIGRQR